MWDTSVVMSTEPDPGAAVPDPGAGFGAESPDEPAAKRSRAGIAGFAASALAGFLLAIGSVLVWAQFQIGGGGHVFTLHGTDTNEGKVVLAAGLVAVVGALLLRVGKTEKGRPVAGIIIVIAAVIGGAATGYFASNAKTKYQDKPLIEFAHKVSQESGLPAAAAAKHEKDLIAAGKVAETFSLGIGVWIALASAIALLIGGILAFMWARRTRRSL
jgi:hypothetical protein